MVSGSLLPCALTWNRSLQIDRGKSAKSTRHTMREVHAEAGLPTSKDEGTATCRENTSAAGA